MQKPTFLFCNFLYFGVAKNNLIYTDADKVAAEFDDAHPVLMTENDCVVVTGNSLLQAFDRLEVMESTAHSILDSMALGPIAFISDEEVEDLKVAFNLKG